jgi:hypothetical protein
MQLRHHTRILHGWGDRLKEYLNLGCGQNYLESDDEIHWTNVDKNPNLKADAWFDLEDEKWNLKENFYDAAVLHHIVEHISNINQFMENLYRVLIPSGLVEIIAPYYTSKWAWGDPDHKRGITEDTFLYWDSEAVAKQPDTAITVLDTKADFRVKAIRVVVNDDAMNEIFGSDDPIGDREKAFAATYYMNAVDYVAFQLEAIKK